LREEYFYEDHSIGEATGADYSKGLQVGYNYTLDTSSYQEGLWHYYYIAKDKNTNNLTRFPVEGYFIGPETSDAPNFLLSPRVTNSEDDYYNNEGWADDEFNFYVYWWDMLNSTVPVNVTLCLVPANRSEGIGHSKTHGIQKFLMSPIDQTPNYTNPVEYYYSVNFTDLGYQDNEIGNFNHYFEAVSEEGGIVNYLGYDINGTTHLEGPIVRSITNPVCSLEVYQSDGDNQILVQSDSTITYLIEYSDPNGVNTSVSPKVVFNTDEENFEYDMVMRENSSDGRVVSYSLTIRGSDLESGAYEPSVELPDGWQGLPYSERQKLRVLYFFNLVEDATLYAMSSMLTLGIIPVLLFIGTSIFALISRPDYYFISSIVVQTAIISLVIGFTANINTGGLLGLSLGSLLLYLALIASVSEEGSPLHMITNSITSHAKLLFFLSYITESSASIFTGLFQGNAILSDVFYIISNIMSIFPQLAVFLVASNTLNILLGLAVNKRSSCSKLFQLNIKIYKTILISLALGGFFTFLSSVISDNNAFY
jgi:hypothetical protein